MKRHFLRLGYLVLLKHLFGQCRSRSDYFLYYEANSCSFYDLIGNFFLFVLQDKGELKSFIYSWGRERERERERERDVYWPTTRSILTKANLKVTDFDFSFLLLLENSPVLHLQTVVFKHKSLHVKVVIYHYFEFGQVEIVSFFH